MWQIICQYSLTISIICLIMWPPDTEWSLNPMKIKPRLNLNYLLFYDQEWHSKILTEKFFCISSSFFREINCPGNSLLVRFMMQCDLHSNENISVAGIPNQSFWTCACGSSWPVWIIVMIFFHRYSLSY